MAPASGTLATTPARPRDRDASRVRGAGDWDLVVGEEDGALHYFENGYCAMGCSSRGVCDESIFTPTCTCLTGYSGDQCWRPA